MSEGLRCPRMPPDWQLCLALGASQLPYHLIIEFPCLITEFPMRAGLLNAQPRLGFAPPAVAALGAISALPALAVITGGMNARDASVRRAANPQDCVLKLTEAAAHPVCSAHADDMFAVSQR